MADIRIPPEGGAGTTDQNQNMQSDDRVGTKNTTQGMNQRVGQSPEPWITRDVHQASSDSIVGHDTRGG